MNRKLLLFLIISVAFAISRFYNLTASPIWEDNFSWHYRMNYYPWIIETNFKGTSEPEKNLKHAGEISYHPGVTLMSLSGFSTRIGKKVLMAQDPNYAPCGFKDIACKYFKTEIAIAKIPLIIVFSVSLFIMLYLIDKKFSFGTSLIFAAFIVLEPFLHLTSRDLHLDYLQTTFCVLALLILYKTSGYKAAAISGILFGLAVLTRFPSLFFTPALFLLSGISKQGILRFCVLMGFAVLSFVVLYPPMWRYPVSTVKYIVENSTSSTKSHNNDTLTTAPVQMYMSGFQKYAQEGVRYMSPFWIVSFVTGFVSLLILEKDRATKKGVLVFTLGFVIYFLLLNTSDKKFFRYLVPVVVGLTIPMSYGLTLLGTKLKSLKAVTT